MQPKISIPTPAQMVSIAETLQLAQQAYDIDKLLDIYHPECLIEYPGLGIKHRGHSSIRPAVALAKSIFRDYETENPEYAFSENKLVAWGRGRMILAGSFNGHIPNGKPAEVMCFTVLKFSGNTVIYEAHYLDQASLSLQSGIPIEALMQMKH